MFLLFLCGGIFPGACLAGADYIVSSNLLYGPADLADTTKPAKLRTPPVPKKALVYSLILPGAGQVYNGHWWKVPFVYGALGGALAVAIDSQTNYNLFQDAYEAKLQGRPLPDGIPPVLDDARRLRVLRDRYDRRRQSWYIYSVAAYGLQAVEALVDAHLQNFDVSEDLSLRLQPSMGLPGPGGMSPGIGLALRLK